MSSILFLIFLIAIAVVATSAKFAKDADAHFELYKSKYGRRYATIEEETRRRAIFHESMARVDRKNLLNGEPAFGITKFSDWTLDEFKVLLGFRRGRNAKTLKAESVEVRKPEEWSKYGMKEYSSAASKMPTNVNWKKAGKITAVKNQGQCGSCWAFSAAEAVESQWAMNGNAIWEFSPQQIASCTQEMASPFGPCCFGCGGGDSVAAYEYLMSAGVTGLGSSYFAPYTQSMTVACSGPECTNTCSSYSQTDLKANAWAYGPYAMVTGYSFATPPCNEGSCSKQNMTMLAQNTAIYGPPSVCVDASQWNDYTGGVLTQAGCGGYAADDIDHCVQLIGYNADDKSPYWIVRNSWATNWGNGGMIHLQYPQNTCGVGNYATFAKIGNKQSDFKI